VKRNQRIGRWGEQAAADFLVTNGYEVISRNTRTPYGEIDVIARRNELFVFIEVKARTSRTFGYPEESITVRKAEHLLSAAEHYAAEHGIEQWQIDAISVEGTPGTEPRITHFENVLSQ
jgi:putative endonuclease